MAPAGNLSQRYQRSMHRLQARLALVFTNPTTGFVSQPEPRSIGSFAKGRQLAAGNIMLAGHLIEAPNAMLWDIDPPDLMFAQDAHGFAWLDDLAAAGDINARKLAKIGCSAGLNDTTPDVGQGGCLISQGGG